LLANGTHPLPFKCYRIDTRSKSAITAVDVRQFGHAINTDQVFGTHSVSGSASEHQNPAMASSGEGCPVLVDKCFERRRWPTTNRFDQVIRAGKDPVLVVNGDLAQVLDEERIARPAVWCLFKLAVQRSVPAGPG